MGASLLPNAAEIIWRRAVMQFGFDFKLFCLHTVIIYDFKAFVLMVAEYKMKVDQSV